MELVDIEFPDEIKKLFELEIGSSKQQYDYEKQLCDYFSSHYGQFAISPDYFRIRTNEFRAIRTLRSQYFKTKQYEIGLEIGCGFGFKTLLLLPFCKSLIATDIPEPYFSNIDGYFETCIDFAKYIINHGLGLDKIDFRHSYLNDLKIDSNSIDFVYSEYVLEHVPQLEQCIAELHRVMRTGGIMVHTVPVTLNHIWQFFDVNMNTSVTSVCKSFLKDIIKRVLNLIRRPKYNYELKLKWNLMTVPPCHSEYLPKHDFMAQMRVYLLESYIFPMIEQGFEILDIIQVRDHNRVIIAQKM